MKHMEIRLGPSASVYSEQAQWMGQRGAHSRCALQDGPGRLGAPLHFVVGWGFFWDQIRVRGREAVTVL